MKHIILFGDSHFGRFGRDYMIELEEAIGGAAVYNCAAGGFNTRDGLKRVNYIAKLQPDYVCLSFGANDASPFKGQPVKLDEFKENLAAIIKAFSGAKAILFPCPPVIDEDPQEAKQFNDSLIGYNQAMKDLARETDSSFIDSETIYGAMAKQGEEYHLEDGLHLNEVGYDKLVEELAKIIK